MKNNNNKLIGRVASKIFACHHDGKLNGFTKVKYTKKTEEEKAKEQRLAELDEEVKELFTQANDLIAEYLDVEEMKLDEIAEELAQIKKRYFENWTEASELM